MARIRTRVRVSVCVLCAIQVWHLSNGWNEKNSAFCIDGVPDGRSMIRDWRQYLRKRKNVGWRLKLNRFRCVRWVNKNEFCFLNCKGNLKFYSLVRKYICRRKKIKKGEKHLHRNLLIKTTIHSEHRLLHSMATKLKSLFHYCWLSYEYKQLNIDNVVHRVLPICLSNKI